VSVIGSTEANSGLLSLVAHIDTYKHGLFGNLGAELHAPQVTAELGVHLANDVEEDAIVVLGDGAVGHELRDDGRVTIDLVLDERVEVLVVRVVGHDHEEDELRVLDLTVGLADCSRHFLVVVILDGLGEGLEEDFFVEGGLVGDRTDISEFDLDAEALLCRKVVELVVDVVCVAYVSF